MPDKQEPVAVGPIGISRTCCGCKMNKDISLFGRDKTALHGRGYYCYVCKRKRDAKYAATQGAKKKAALRSRKRYYRNRDAANKRRKQYPCDKTEPLETRRIKERARRAVRTAIESGEVIKPDLCQDCGQRSPLHGHHDDYSKPLDVAWLCSFCHGRRHRKYDSQESGS